MASAANIPVIDISAERLDQPQVAADLVEAAVEHGFIYIKNMGKDIPVDVVENAFNLARLPPHLSASCRLTYPLQSTKLFNAPLEEKHECKMLQNNRGWAGMHEETLDPKNQRVRSKLPAVGSVTDARPGWRLQGVGGPSALFRPRQGHSPR
jgi:isopenicillin N synthase-like dioxygenase